MPPGPRAGDLGLLVLRTADVDAARSFYEAVGLRFVEEQHGDGPRHLAAPLPSGVVVELYPAVDGEPIGRGGLSDVRLGFVVDGLDRVVERLTADGHPLVSPARSTDRGRRAVAADPDGRRVELQE